MTISELKRDHPEKFSGYYRIRKPFKCLASNGSPYLSCLLEDMSGSMKAFAWPGRYQGKTSFADLDRVFVNGRMCSLQHSTVIHVEEAEVVQSVPDSPTTLIPRSLCPQPHLLDHLGSVMESIGNEALRIFVRSILADDSIALRFISLPASGKHHHSHAGGLLEHSLSCADIVSRFHEFPQHMLELGIIGALFHDIGKIHSYSEDGARLNSAYVLDHDDLTLEVLANHLKLLDTHCKDAGTALRYIWSWRRNRHSRRIPLITISEAVLLADHISAGLSAEDLAFRDSQEWRQTAKLNDRTRFWRPKLTSSPASPTGCHRTQ